MAISYTCWVWGPCMHLPRRATRDTGVLRASYVFIQLWHTSYPWQENMCSKELLSWTVPQESKRLLIRWQSIDLGYNVAKFITYITEAHKNVLCLMGNQRTMAPRSCWSWLWLLWLLSYLPACHQTFPVKSSHINNLNRIVTSEWNQATSSNLLVTNWGTSAILSWKGWSWQR